MLYRIRHCDVSLFSVTHIKKIIDCSQHHRIALCWDRGGTVSYHNFLCESHPQLLSCWARHRGWQRLSHTCALTQSRVCLCLRGVTHERFNKVLTIAFLSRCCLRFYGKRGTWTYEEKKHMWRRLHAQSVARGLSSANIQLTMECKRLDFTRRKHSGVSRHIEKTGTQIDHFTSSSKVKWDMGSS